MSRWLVIGVWWANVAGAAPFVHQGRALHADGTAVNGSTTVVVRLFGQASGGTALWTENQTVTLEDGFYSLELGSLTPIPGQYLDGRSLWVEVEVGGAFSRAPIAEVPRATLASRMAVRATVPHPCDTSAIGAFYLDSVSDRMRVCTDLGWKDIGIANDPPSTPVVAVTPARPQPGGALTCAVTTPSVDPEGQPVTYDYLWLVDGVATGNISATLPGSATTAGQRWTCRVTPRDGISSGASAEAEERVGQRFQFAYGTTANQTFTAPSWATEIVASVWGAAGGGGSAENGSHRGGAGGFVEGRIPVAGNESLIVKVGQGGNFASTFGYEAWPNGGINSARTNYSSGGGGGRSAVMRGSTELFVAGGGGGAGATGGNAGGNNLQGGGGGYPTGGDGSQAVSPNCYGRGGTQSAGGLSGVGCASNTGSPGDKNQGGHGGLFFAQGPSAYGSENCGGGGGDGYYGGGSGAAHAGGGGGSSYYVLTALDVVAPGPSTTANPPNNTHAEYASGVGVGNTAAIGGHGRVVIWAY
jgi:hypothetical protein